MAWLLGRLLLLTLIRRVKLRSKYRLWLVLFEIQTLNLWESLLLELPDFEVFSKEF